MARTADLVGDTCSLLIVRDLLEGPQRFSELEKSLQGVSTRTLASKLKNLSEKGLITHRLEFYSLTPIGKAMKPVVESMRVYCKKYL